MITESQTLTAMLVMWGSALASGIVNDIIPFTATTIPVVQELARAEGLSEPELCPLWWALTIGANFGGT